MTEMIAFLDSFFDFAFYVPFNWSVSFLIQLPAWLLFGVMVWGVFLGFMRRF